MIIYLDIADSERLEKNDIGPLSLEFEIPQKKLIAIVFSHCSWVQQHLQNGEAKLFKEFSGILNWIQTLTGSQWGAASKVMWSFHLRLRFLA